VTIFNTRDIIISLQLIACQAVIAADRLSGWTEQSQIKSGTSDSGSKGLCSAFRKLFMTFGVPVEVSSDGGPEFKASETTAFFQKWGVRHRIKLHAIIKWAS